MRISIIIYFFLKLSETRPSSNEYKPEKPEVFRYYSPYPKFKKNLAPGYESSIGFDETVKWLNTIDKDRENFMNEMMQIQNTQARYKI